MENGESNIIIYNTIDGKASVARNFLTPLCKMCACV